MSAAGSRRRTALRTAGAGAACAAAFGLAVAPAAAAKTVTFEVTSVSLAVTRHDVPPKGASRGDTITYRDRLLNAAPQWGRAKGAVVGSDRGTMTWTSARTATFKGVAQLPDGTVDIEGAVVPVQGGYLAFPVVGGTGRYLRARGFVLVGPGTTRALNVYRLTVPAATVA